LADHPSALDCHEGITYYTANHDSAVATAQRFMNAPDLVALVHLAGFATGIPLFAAVLGLIWNAGTVVVFRAALFRARSPQSLVYGARLDRAGIPASRGHSNTIAAIIAAFSRRRRRRSATASMTTSISSPFR
jgi:hypothetical protein